MGLSSPSWSQIMTKQWRDSCGAPAAAGVMLFEDRSTEFRGVNIRVGVSSGGGEKCVCVCRGRWGVSAWLSSCVGFGFSFFLFSFRLFFCFADFVVVVAVIVWSSVCLFLSVSLCLCLSLPLSLSLSPSLSLSLCCWPCKLRAVRATNKDQCGIMGRLAGKANNPQSPDDTDLG